MVLKSIIHQYAGVLVECLAYVSELCYPILIPLSSSYLVTMLGISEFLTGKRFPVSILKPEFDIHVHSGQSKTENFQLSGAYSLVANNSQGFLIYKSESTGPNDL